MIFYTILFSLVLISSKCEESGYEGLEILGKTEGTVGNHSFAYYYIYHSGSIILSLRSSYGDTDLYISEDNVLPTYHLESYDLHSATCGLDVIEIPDGIFVKSLNDKPQIWKSKSDSKVDTSFRSPISVGIYGHSAHESSSFVLEVYKKPTENPTTFLYIDDEIPEATSMPKSRKRETKTSPIEKVKQKLPTVSNKISGIFSLFEIIQLVFL